MTGTIFSRILQQASRAPKNSAIKALGRESLSYEDLCSHVQYVAATLNTMGIQKHDRIAVVLPNGPEMAIACLAVMSCAVAAPLNPEYREDEYAAYFDSISPRLLIALAGGEIAAREVALRAGIPILEIVPNERSAAGIFQFSGGPEVAVESHAVFSEAGDPALLLHTSGTTSRPRKVVLTQKNLLSSANNLASTLRIEASDSCLHMLPMFHIGGLIDVLAAPLITGGSVICTSGFSVPGFFQNMDAYRPTWTQTVPAMLQEILEHADEHKAVLGKHSLRLMRSVSSPLPVAAANRFEEMFRIPVIEIFGMTETSGQITSNHLPPAQRKPGSVGNVVACEVRVVDEAGNSVPAGDKGEIVVCGDNVMHGYDEPEPVNRDAYFGDWLRTGDLGYLDEDGYLFLVGRIKEIINRGGEKIAPAEVDEAIRRHPAVSDAAVFAVPHATLGEDVAVAVVLKGGHTLSRQDLVEYGGQHLAYFKVPRKVYFVPAIPRTPSGKIQRFKLTEIVDKASADETAGVAGFVAVEGLIEKVLAEMWSRALKVERIGLNDDFFDLGGDSLKAASFINDLQQKWGGTVYVSALFDAPTIARFRDYLERHYPELLLRALGRQVSPGSLDSGGKVDKDKLEALRRSIVQTTGSHSGQSKPSQGKNPRAVFILSPPRSGSTLLRAMLGGNPRLFAPPELYLLSFDNLADRKAWFSGSQKFQLEGNTRCLMQIKDMGLEEAEKLVAELEEKQMPTGEYYRMLQEWMGDRILIDKTPYYASHIETLRRAEEYFDQPLYIHLKRHPYGMIRSFEEAKLDQLWYPRLVGVEKALHEPCPYTRRELAEMIWLVLNQNIIEFLREIPGERQYSIKFEDLVGEPANTVNGLCRFLGVDYDKEMLNPQSKQSERMTDGTRSVSRMIGDMKFHQHKGISAGAAELWKQHYEVDFLSDETMRLAESLGFTETLASVKNRKVFEF